MPVSTVLTSVQTLRPFYFNLGGLRGAHMSAEAQPNPSNERKSALESVRSKHNTSNASSSGLVSRGRVAQINSQQPSE